MLPVLEVEVETQDFRSDRKLSLWSHNAGRGASPHQLLQILRQPFTELGSGTKQDALDGWHCGSHDLSNLFVRHFLIPPEDDGHALRFGQIIDGFLNRELKLFFQPSFIFLMSLPSRHPSSFARGPRQMFSAP